MQPTDDSVTLVCYGLGIMQICNWFERLVGQIMACDGIVIACQQKKCDKRFGLG